MTTKITVNVPPELYEALEAEAQQVGLTVNEYASQIIADIVRNQEQKDDH